MPALASPCRYSIPGRPTKEAFVNEALLLSDALMHCLVLGEAATPPENSLENDAWIVASGATREWSGQDGAVALRRGGGWAFVAPRDGLRVFDASRGAEMLFFGFWRKGSLPVEPLGGTSVDGEARTAINDLIAALQALGILPSV